MATRSLKGTWRQAILTFLAPFSLLLIIRWLLVEPYIIPSGSMIPNLMIHDHIVVNKLSYGIRIPFTEKWLAYWGPPKRGDVVVFKYPLDKEVYYVKRVIARAGDKVQVENDEVFINDQKLPQELLSPAISDVPELLLEPEKRLEQNGDNKYVIQVLEDEQRARPYGPVTVPEGHIFVMGDNRDQSSDARVWGFMPENLLLGKAMMIWLSCQETLSSAPSVCDLKTIRPERLFKRIQ